MQLSQPHQTRLLQIYRDFLKPGAEVAYQEIEEEAARICARLTCPNPYLAIESLTDPKEVWYLNGYRSDAHKAEVADGYRTNASLMAALDPIPRRKADLIFAPQDVDTTLRADLTRGEPWHVGMGRYLVITMSEGRALAAGTVFEAADGLTFVVAPADSEAEADALAAERPAVTRVFAVRPSMSLPAPEWIAADPAFWTPR